MNRIGILAPARADANEYLVQDDFVQDECTGKPSGPNGELLRQLATSLNHRAHTGSSQFAQYCIEHKGPCPPGVFGNLARAVPSIFRFLASVGAAAGF